MNAASECPKRYKDSVIRSYVHRAYKTCTSADDLSAELKRCKQIFVNNGFSNLTIDDVTKNYHRKAALLPRETRGATHTVKYQNQMTSAYKTDERALTSIIDRNVVTLSDDDTVKLLIYYKNQKVSSLVSRNNPIKKIKFQSTNVLYKFSCPNEDCKLQRNVEYVGMTTTTLSRRLTCHLSSGGPKEHMRTKHETPITRRMLEENTSIIKQYQDSTRLAVAEALLIRELSPAINSQTTGFTRTLKFFSGN
jgi:hypothetical protein